MKAHHAMWVVVAAVAALVGWYLLDKRRTVAPATPTVNAPAVKPPGGGGDAVAQRINAGANAISALGNLFGGAGSDA